MSKAGCDDADNGQADVGPCLIKDQDFDASTRCDFAARENVLVQIVGREVREVLDAA